MSAVEAILHCAICLEPFNRPKLLCCGHTFCLGCLQQLVRPPDKSLLCPLCLQKTIVPAGGVSKLKDDFRFNQIKDALQETLVAQKTGRNLTTRRDPGIRNRRLCVVCRLLPTVVCCLQCQKYMCTICHDGHNQKDNAAYHTIVRVQDIAQCNIHNTPCTHACRRCRRFVCVQCLRGNCSKHVCHEIGTAVKQDIESGKYKEILQNAEKTLQNYEVRVSEINQKIAAAEQEVQTHLDLVLHAITREGQRLKSELQDMKKEAIEKLELSYTSAQEIRAKLAPVVEAKPGDLWKQVPPYTLHAIWLNRRYGNEPSDSTDPVGNAGKVWYKRKCATDNIRLGEVTTEPKLKRRFISRVFNKNVIQFMILCIALSILTMILMHLGYFIEL